MLVVISTSVMLTVGELAVRFYATTLLHHDSVDDERISKYFSTYAASPLSVLQFYDQPLADRHVNDIPVPRGLDKSWFRQSPPYSPRNRSNLSPHDADLYGAYTARDIFGPQSFYIWNRVFAEQHVCLKNDYIFKNYGPLASKLRVFSPPNNSPFPRYRFPKNTLTPSGLRTNQYGFRGPSLLPKKNFDTIRIAFLGASTTVAQHQFPYSYPEHFGYWLNLWLEANHYPFRVEIINAGREGVGSSDIAAIFREEVLPLHPDYVIYYEGANQMTVPAEWIRSSSPVRPYSQPELLPKTLRGYSHAARLVEDFYKLRLAELQTEWARPPAELVFGDDIDEFNPDIMTKKLSSNLSTILTDLYDIAQQSRKHDVRFLVSSFVWLDGSEPSLVHHNPRHREILSHTDQVFWPLKTKDIRRLVDFQNRALRRFADEHDVGFLDLAGLFPRDPDLFTDAIHFTPEGVRLQGWVALATFLPYFMQDLSHGRKEIGVRSETVETQWNHEVEELYDAQCLPNTTQLVSKRAVPLNVMELAYERSSMSQIAEGVLIRSAPIPWAYIGRVPLHVDCGTSPSGDRGWIGVEISVLSGHIGVGVLNHSENAFTARSVLEHEDGSQMIYLPVASFKEAGDLIVQNGGISDKSEGIVRSISLIRASGNMADCLVGYKDAT